jgi:hypothetical protein
METGASYQFLGIHRRALGTSEAFLTFTDLHEAIKDMLAGTAFKLIDGHGKLPLFRYSEN